VIKSFGDVATEAFASGKNSARARRIPVDIRTVAARKLFMIETAETLSDLRSPPGNRLEPLKGNLAAFHSIRINQQWRVIFRWTDAGAEDVQIVDYH
jgi:toxin HigB-1